LEDIPENSKQPPKQVGNVLVEKILELILEAGLSSSQAREVLDRVRETIDLGEEQARIGTVH